MNGASKVAAGGTCCFVQSDFMVSNKNSSRNQARLATSVSHRHASVTMAGQVR